MSNNSTNKIRGAFFDFCGTIFNNEQFHTAALHSAFAEHIDSEVFIDDDELRSNVGLTYNDRLANMLAMRGIDDDELLQNMTDHALTHYRQADKSDALVPGVADCIRELHKAGITLAIVSSARHASIEKDLEEVGLLQYFSSITGGDDVRFRKPHPFPYEKNLENYGFEPHETVAFEDSPPGVEAAWLAGIPVIGILTSFTREDLHKASLTAHDYTGLTLEQIEAANAR